MLIKPSLLALFGSLAIALPSCDSSSTSSTEPTKPEKPAADHHSTATLQIHFTRPYEPDAPLQPSPNFLNNQTAILSSQSLIQEAAEDAGVAPEIIEEALWIEPIPDTDLITLSAYHDDREMAKRIAESLIKTYISRRNQLDHDRAEETLHALDHELMIQGDLVQDHRKTLTVLIQQDGIPYFDGRSESSVGLPEEKALQRSRQKLDEFEVDRDQLMIQTQRLKNADGEELMRIAAGLDLPDNQVTPYYQTYREHLETVRTKLATGLGTKHPSVIEAQKKADLALEQAKNKVTTLRKILETRLTLLNKQVEKMKEIVDAKQGNAVNLSLKQHQYNQAKEDYEQARDMYRDMKVRQQESRVLLKMPRTPVTIHGWTHE